METVIRDVNVVEVGGKRYAYRHFRDDIGRMVCRQVPKRTLLLYDTDLSGFLVVDLVNKDANLDIVPGDWLRMEFEFEFRQPGKRRWQQLVIVKVVENLTKTYFDNL